MTTTSPVLEARDVGAGPAATPVGLPMATVLEVRDRCLCLATQRAARLLAQRFDRLFAPLGINNGQFSILVALSGSWHPRLGELAAFLAMSSATMTAAARILARQGLLVLQPEAADGRIRRPVLTDAGRNIVRRAVPLWREEHVRLEVGLDIADLASTKRLLPQLR
jgi:DNA-binding MarR family transcriptional regulator